MTPHYSRRAEEALARGECVDPESYSVDTGVTYTEHDMHREPLFPWDYPGVARKLVYEGYDAKLSDDGFITTNAPLSAVRNAIALHVDTSGT